MAERTPTETQLAVLQLIANGCTHADIANRLGLAQNTIRTHSHNMLVRLHVHSQAAAVAVGFRKGWLR